MSPIAGLVLAPFAFLGAACALMSLVLACVHVHETSTSPAVNSAAARTAERA